ncbi:MAG: discoidin domain-containing protein [Phycisphaeraceae bacterium]|nr:discoidin domain-containing protein [Phycisphaeraceae bacterium]
MSTLRRTVSVFVIVFFCMTCSISAEPLRLAAGETHEIKLPLPSAHSAALRIHISEADFGGASLQVRFNGKDLVPYHAFGGDTRYDNVKGKPGLHPPTARIEANYSLIKEWTQAENTIVITNAGPGHVTISEITLVPCSAHDLPRYENSIYFDFDVWRQASVMHPGINWYLDSMLLGVIPGGGTQIMNYSGPESINQLKLAAEDARVNWGFKRSTFYSIWHLANGAKAWGQFIDVDHNPATPVIYAPDGKELTTTGKIHVQFANPPEVPAGTEIALIKPNGYLDALKPGIDGLQAYSSDYNFTCEQWGPRGQGFGRWWGDNLAAQGYDAKKWADNYQTEFSKVTGYAHEKNPASPVWAPHWWIPDIRFLLYDTAIARNMPMRDMTDGMMTHYYSFPFAGYTKEGKPVMDDDKSRPAVAQPELQYPGGKFETPDWERSRPYMGTNVLIPEIAIDWNRYRLSRTEKDLLPSIDKTTHRWRDGRPFTFTAGFDGDEQAYNNETCVYDRNYSAPAPYQFLYAMFSYSLLPSGAGESKEFAITRTLPLTPEAKPTDDIFSEVQIPINKYGDWVVGAAGTHRLKTRDPLYGDMFGYTGFEQATTGDYIWLSGIKERHHRKSGADAWNLVRRTCYAFVTADRVYPAIVNDADTQNLFVKTLLIKQAGRDVIAIYAVNFHGQPHQLDISLPTAWAGVTVAQVFDEKAADWADAREIKWDAGTSVLQVKAKLPAGSPYAMFIYPPAGEAGTAFTRLATPHPASPWGNQNVTSQAVELKWSNSNETAGVKDGSVRYEIQLAREMLFRSQDMVLTQGDCADTHWKVAASLVPNQRYHWRVRAIDEDGNSTPWSKPESFWYQAGAGASPVAVSGDCPAISATPPRAEQQPDLKPFTDSDNLAHTGMPFSYPNYWEGAAEACDGFALSAWMPDQTDPNEGRKPEFPAWWAVRFDDQQTVTTVSLLWTEGNIGKDFAIQTWDGKSWQTARSVKGNTAVRSDMSLDAPISTRAVRVWITAPEKETAHLAEVYVK